MEKLIEILASIENTERWVFVAGNGGSAANASHFVTDLLKSCNIRALSLVDNVPLITMLANDYEYESIFEKQLRRYLRPVDIFIALSVSGMSKNVLVAMEYARDLGARTFALTGASGGILAKISDHAIKVPDEQPELVEDAHLRILHQVVMELKHG